METKRWYASKTMWANGLALIATLFGAWGIDLGLDPKGQAEIVVGIMAVVNIVLRAVTTKPVTAARPSEPLS